MAATPLPDTASIVELEREHIFQNYARHPLIIEKGEGCAVFDRAGKRYLDFVSGIGVNALGHGHPRILAAMRDQMDKLIHCSNLYYHPFQAPLATRLAQASGLQRAFFCNSGAEAVETGLKIAKGFGHEQSPDKYEIVALNHGFAGRSLGATSVTGAAKYHEPFEPLLPGVQFVEPNDTAGLESAVSDRTAGILFEPILGEGGLVEISRDFAARAATLARQLNALLIFDEIQCGLGRTGDYFAYQAWNQRPTGDPELDPIQPDVILIAKPLGGGLPMGCVLANEQAAAVLKPGLHGSTFGGNALACRAALEFLNVLEEILPQIRETGAYFAQQLEGLVSKYDFASEVRGRGLMRGLNLTVPGKWVVAGAAEEGFLINCTSDTVLRFLPPYIIERDHIDELVATLDGIFEKGPPT